MWPIQGNLFNLKPKILHRIALLKHRWPWFNVYKASRLCCKTATSGSTALPSEFIFFVKKVPPLILPPYFYMQVDNLNIIAEKVDTYPLEFVESLESQCSIVVHVVPTALFHHSIAYVYVSFILNFFFKFLVWTVLKTDSSLHRSLLNIYDITQGGREGVPWPWPTVCRLLLVPICMLRRQEAGLAPDLARQADSGFTGTLKFVSFRPVSGSSWCLIILQR